MTLLLQVYDLIVKIIIRNFRNIDMMPSSLIGGIFIVIVSFIFKDGNIFTSFHDILYCFLWGAILNGFMNIAFIFSTKHLHASEVSFSNYKNNRLPHLQKYLNVSEKIYKAISNSIGYYDKFPFS